MQCAKFDGNIFTTLKVVENKHLAYFL